MMTPPPMPRSPERNPTIVPIARYAAASGTEELEDEAPLLRGDRRDGQAVAAPQHHHVLQLAIAAHLLERHHARLLHQLHVHQHPARRLALRFRVEVRALAVEL